MLCHSVFSCRLPSRSFQRRLVARLKLATGWPEGSERISGSRPRLPTRITLLTMGPDLLLPIFPASADALARVGESIMAKPPCSCQHQTENARENFPWRTREAGDPACEPRPRR